MPQPVNKSKTSTSKLPPLVFLIVVLVITAGLLVNRDRILDWWRLRGYVPAVEISRLADQTTMNSFGRHLFYINRPMTVSNVDGFRKACPENQDTIVLGCYHSGENGIAVYQVADNALNGVEQVTAAHEMLHAAYERLSSGDRNLLNSQLQDYYLHGLTDNDVKAEISLYQKTEPTAVSDEMHSLFGTEVSNLPGPLESHYRLYFNNRAQVVAYDKQYHNQFTARQTTIASDDKQLANLKTIIDAEEASLKDLLAQISAERSRINVYLSSNQVSEYNAAVPAFNAKINSYNAGITKLQADTDIYNQLVVARNQIARQLATLDKALDTRTAQPVSH